MCRFKSALFPSVKTLEQTLLTAGALLRSETLPVKYDLANRIRKELQRTAIDHCYIHAAELDKICPDRDARKIRLRRFAERNGFALAWYHETIGAIFTEPSPRPGQPTKEVLRRSQQPQPRSANQQLLCERCDVMKKELAARIRKAFKRDPQEHSFIHATELDDCWPDRATREAMLQQFSYKYGIALAWHDENIGAIFVKKENDRLEIIPPIPHRQSTSNLPRKFRAPN